MQARDQAVTLARYAAWRPTSAPSLRSAARKLRSVFDGATKKLEAIPRARETAEAAAAAGDASARSLARLAPVGGYAEPLPAAVVIIDAGNAEGHAAPIDEEPPHFGADRLEIAAVAGRLTDLLYGDARARIDGALFRRLAHRRGATRGGWDCVAI